jgi:hypothetical protein
MLRFQPTSPGPKSATITVISNDPTGPHKISVSGDGQTPRLSLVMADSGDFGKVCVHSSEDEPLLLSNSGKCALSVASITSSSADFIVGEVLFYPLTIGAGDSLPIPIRFQPGSAGLKSATITVNSNDQTGPHTITVSGDGHTPRLSLMIADTGDFGKVCIGSFVDKPLTLINSGRCMLTVTNITSSDSEFLAPLVSAYPIAIAAGCALEAPIRFQPASFGLKAATITVSSDDPAGLRTMAVSGFAPSGKLTVTGSTSFGGVTACCCADRTISVCNVGACDLHVTNVRFKRKSHHWKLFHNPFPATLHAGSSLNVVIRYKATEKCPRSCELIIESDDPSTPVKTMEVLAYTIWDPCRCKDCCEDCRKGGCDKRHQDSCCRQGYPCCDDDDEEDDHDD